ncbi:FAD-binding oxidoreductase [Sphingomonas koreensis]|uniref:FAD-binding oxidoreductase n=1 Tax=Sphingomonas koreensis TaxID=93064 RepID=A0A430G424_9SPHN|nr:FAD-binding oxidoreductase [Sphingomonas koreensis]RSY85916.1 FAD-binding oxidoreductase [Sphingomonas koreensis]
MTGSAVTTVPASASPTDPCLSALSETLGADLFVQDEDARAACLRDMTGNWPSGAQAVARPRSTAEVARLVQAAAAQGIAIVPQGGNTGLVGGCAVPEETPALLLSTRRLRSIRAIDLHAPAVIAEAGCILAEVQEAVAAHGFTIPLGLGSEGSATIGGLVSTNAGGIRALRHGVMRNQVLGLEVVLPDGRVWNGLRTLAKNNMGYDLKQLFVGGEGTLGVVTAAALRLVPASRQIETLWLSVEDPAAALALLGALRTALGDLVTSFELIQRRGVEWGMAAVPGLRVPDSGAHGWFVLAEVATAATGLPLRAAVESALADVFEQGLALDGMLAESEAQRRELWRIREAVVVGKAAGKPSISVDVAVPLGQVPAFLVETEASAAGLLPGCETLGFGHLGDGNIHFSVHRGANDTERFAGTAGAIAAKVEAIALRLGGTICAEHGVGRRMRAALADALDAAELDLIRAVKRALDPHNRMNPGAVIEL